MNHSTPSYVTLLRRLKCLSCAVVLLFTVHLYAEPAVWQWSVPVASATYPQARAFLWVPPECESVRALVVGQNNMLEIRIFEDLGFRRKMSELGIGIVWIAPMLDPVFEFDQGAGERFKAMLDDLVEVSGYRELAKVPIVPIGHSACASFSWNFAAWKPERTLAVISYKGDMPQSDMTGSGRPNPDWGDRSIAGVPGLMVMGEYEWIVGRYQPGLAFRERHPNAPIALLAEPGSGHFDVPQEAPAFLSMFIEKALAARMPHGDPSKPLVHVDPKDGWLVQAWDLDQQRFFEAAPYADYKGPKRNAFWAFDQEMAEAIEKHRAEQIGKAPQLLAFLEDGELIPQTNSHHQVSLAFEPEADGVTFSVAGGFLDTVDSGADNLARWTQLPVGSSLGHGFAEQIQFEAIAGPAVQVESNRFQFRYNRASHLGDHRQRDIWLLATHPGDGKYKSAVQQALLRIPEVEGGLWSVIEFTPIADIELCTKTVDLLAHSSSGHPVYFYVREGPAYVVGDKLHLTAIPANANLPMAVHVVAWQSSYRDGNTRFNEAVPVAQTFYIRSR